MRDNMLPAMHAAAEALRNFTGLIDDADQRAVFRQRDPGLDAAFAPAARPRPVPNSAADAPTQLRVRPCQFAWECQQSISYVGGSEQVSCFLSHSRPCHHARPYLLSHL